MKIKRQDYGNVTVFELQGELDGDLAEVLKDSLLSITNDDKVGIVFDMSNVSFITSEGLEQLLWIHDRCKNGYFELRLAELDEYCSKILEITRLDNEFHSYSELSEAVKSFV